MMTFDEAAEFMSVATPAEVEETMPADPTAEPTDHEPFEPERWDAEDAYWQEAEMARWDDDPNPYHGDYSEM